MNKDKQLPGDPSLPSSAEEIQQLIGASNGQYKYSVEDFFRLPEKSRYQLSPGGTHFAYMRPFQRRQNLFVEEVGKGASPVQITFETERDINDYFWPNNDRLLYIKDSGGDENFTLHAVNKDGSGHKDLTPFPGVRISIIDPLPDHEEEVIIGMNKNNPQLFEPYRININTGALRQLAVNDNPAEPVSDWMTDHEGRLRIAVKVKDGINTVLMYRPDEESEFREVLTTDFRVSVQPLFFEFDNGSIVYVSSNLGRDKQIITRFDLEKGREVGEPVFQHPDVDVSALSYSRKRKVLTAVLYNTDIRHRHYLDQEVRDIFDRLEQDLGAYEIFITSMNKDEDKFMVRTFSDRSLGAYYFFDKNSSHLEKLADISPWLDESDMAEMKPIRFRARDGLLLWGYLTLPKGGEARNLPCVVHPHGGPWARDSWGFDPEVQLMASRGYAVLMINFRGSVGFGRSFWESSFKEWGKKMQDDITDGVEWLIGQGIADPKRIGIYGGSYGGYAVLAGLAFTPGLYACGVDYVGVSNLFTFMNTIPPYWRPYLEMMRTMVGDPEKDEQYMKAASPVFHVDQIQGPLFVVQGANDPRVNIDESDQIVRSLRERGVDVPYLVKYNEGHGFGNEENRFEFYKAMMGFLERHLKGN